MKNFERCHAGGHAYDTYKKLESKFTDEFQGLTFRLMVEIYIRLEMQRPNHITDRDLQNLKSIWRSVAEELKVLSEYPYSMDSFPFNHPLAGEASIEAKRLLGIG